jgi:lipopolysaccharide export system protein LptA
MKRSEAARYARWSAAVALVLATVTAGVYLQRGWKARSEMKHAPAAAAANVARQSNGVTFSKGEGSRKEFTVQASRSTDFKDRDLTELEAVVITIFGKNGDRHDVIHTQSCQYGKTDGNVVCSGEVRMDLESAADLQRAENPGAVPQVMHVVTKAVTFNQKSGAAMTAEPVSFSFPNGSGQGVGMEYKSEAGTVKLQREVRLKLRPPAPAASPAPAKGKSRPAHPQAAAADAGPAAGSGAPPEEEVTVTGTSLDFDRASRRMHVQGPAVAESKATRLTAGELLLDLDVQFRAQTLRASGNVNDQQPQIVSREDTGQMEVNADHLAADFAPQGWVTAVNAQGHVTGVRHTDAERDDASAEDAIIAMWPRVNEVKELNLRGDVTLKTLASASGDARVLRTEALRMDFNGGKPNEASKPLKAETLAAGRMEWTETNAKDINGSAPVASQAGTPKPRTTRASSAEKIKSSGENLANAGTTATAAHTTLAADKLQLVFDGLGKPKQLLADGHVRTERTMAEKPTQTATAQSGVAQMLPGGGWSQMDLHGAVKLHEGDRSGQADHAVFRRAEQTATLSGRALVRDANTETAAARIVFVQNTGDIHADGGVRSTDLPTSSSAGATNNGAAASNNGPGGNAVVHLAPAPTHITSDQLQGNSQSGRAFYSGHARMWQGESVLESDSIELLRETRVLNALGNVRAVFPQATATPAVAGTNVASSGSSQGTAATTSGTTAGVSSARAPATTPATATALAKTSGPSSSPSSKTIATTLTAPQSEQKKSPLWHVTAQSLTYNDAESHAHLEHDVRAQSADQKMRAPIVDLYFTRGAQATASGTEAAANMRADGPQQISRAVGTGGTTVEEGGRKATAERGVYTAADGKFVMSGGNPTLYDSTEGNTTGRQLTFFLADDTIIVDSENGSRVLTRHRVDR